MWEWKLTPLELAFVLLAVLLLVGIWASILRKAGYSAWWALLTLLPPVGLLVLILLAVSDWPVRRKLRELRVRHGIADDEELQVYLSEGCRLDRRGEFAEAMVKYQEIATRFADRPAGRDARNYIVSLRAKMDRAE